MAMGSIRQWIVETMTPVVMIISSPEADAMLADRDGLTVADLLRSSAVLRQLNGNAAPSPSPGCYPPVSCLPALSQRAQRENFGRAPLVPSRKTAVYILNWLLLCCAQCLCDPPARLRTASASFVCGSSPPAASTSPAQRHGTPGLPPSMEPCLRPV